MDKGFFGTDRKKGGWQKVVKRCPQCKEEIEGINWGLVTEYWCEKCWKFYYIDEVENDKV
jgi:hypothetical protein